MTIRVNLLPREIDERRVARRITSVSVLCVVVFLAALGVLYVNKLGQVSDAEAERAQVQAEVARLEQQVAELEHFRLLAEEVEARNVLLATAMAQEVSFARVLNDLSLGFPTSSSLLNLNAVLQEPQAPVGAGDESVVNVTFEGYSVERYAPGVETVVIEFDRVPTFFHTFVGTARLEDRDGTEVTNFTGTVQLNQDAWTGRYEQGLPEGVPQ